jgi:hypothetical protein
MSKADEIWWRSSTDLRYTSADCCAGRTFCYPPPRGLGIMLDQTGFDYDSINIEHCEVRLTFHFVYCRITSILHEDSTAGNRIGPVTPVELVP